MVQPVSRPLDDSGEGGAAAVPGNGPTATRSWPGALGAINVGHFVGGPREINRQ